MGHGNITVGGTALEQNGELTDAGKTAPSLIALNRDTTTTTKELWNSEQSQTVDASVDHRLLTPEGLKEIKKDMDLAYNGVASFVSDIDPTLKAKTGETGSRAYDALRRQGLSDAEANAKLSDPTLVNILNRLDNAEIALAQGGKQTSDDSTPPPSTAEQPASALPPGAVAEVVVTGKTLEQTATEDAVLALNDLKNYIGKTRETNPTTATVLETGISLATGSVVVTAVSKGIDFGLEQSGMAEEVGKQISKVTDPVIEAAANGIERYDLSGEEFHAAVVSEGEEGEAASIKGGTGFFISSVLGVGGVAAGVGKKSTTGPYSPASTRKDLEETYGAENVTSTTVPNNPYQRVNSNPEKGVEVIYGENGGKAVKVTYVDPKTLEELQANIPYNDRGLPIFDDVAKFTTDIDKTKSYTAQMSQATRDLREGIKNGQIDSSQFTEKQLIQINSGSPTIKDMTWHHNAEGNNMQLIPKYVHDAVKHVGQGSMGDGV